MESVLIQSRKDFDNIVDQAGNYILSWMQNELNSVARSQLLIIELAPNLYRIKNLYLAKHPECSEWSVFNHDEFVHSFAHRLSAIFYCILWNDNNITGALQILNLDQSLMFRWSDQKMLAKKLRNKQISADKRDIFLSKYRENHEQINILSHRLQKCIDNAKYKKIRKLL